LFRTKHTKGTKVSVLAQEFAGRCSGGRCLCPGGIAALDDPYRQCAEQGEGEGGGGQQQSGAGGVFGDQPEARAGEREGGELEEGVGEEGGGLRHGSELVTLGCGATHARLVFILCS